MATTQKRRRHDLSDPLYRRIVEELETVALLPDLFERVMGELVKEDFPGSVPIRGGSDAGWDGAVAEGLAEPFPLICTTERRVERNFRKSLEALEKRPLERRMVVLATSRRLTPAEQRKLYDIAREKSFILRQILEQEEVAIRLLGKPFWRKQLLGLSGDPSALSCVPRTRRPLAFLHPVGRTDDLAWIRRQRQDFILQGQPGSGKTFLFSHLIKKGWDGLFLVSADEGRIADALREQQPRFVVVDDAHVEPERLTRLLRLRHEINAEFSIVGVTWEGALDEVRQAMGEVSEARVRRLELLTRQEILEIFQQAGVEAEDDILRDLVSQAAHKPGLAVTIAQLWRQGDWQKILDGSVLKRTLVGFFKGAGLVDASEVLACFSLGGRRGMPMEAVGDFLRMQRSTLRHCTANLAAGGVLAEKEDCLAVEPGALRSALLREVFFSGHPVDWDYRELLAAAPSRPAGVDAIVEAVLRGAKVECAELRELVREAGGEGAWRGLAGLGEHTAWVLEHFPGSVVKVGREALESRPELAASRLLERAAQERRSAHQPAKALRLLDEWAVHLRVGVEESLWRRSLLAREAVSFLRRGGAAAIGVEAICIAFSPELSASGWDPGEGNTFQMAFGTPPIHLLKGLISAWDLVEPELPALDSATWAIWRSFLWEWMNPGWVWKRGRIPADLAAAAQAFTARVLGALAGRTGESSGLVAALLDRAEARGIVLPLLRDASFERLFPPDADQARHPDPSRAEALRELAGQLSQGTPEEVFRDLISYDKEARLADRFFWPPGTLAVSRELAGLVVDPRQWLKTGLAAEAPGYLIAPWLDEVARSRPPGWERTLARCLSSDRVGMYALEAVLRMADPPSPLLESALMHASGHLRSVDSLCLLGEVSLETLGELLRHPTPLVALTAALAEWTAEPPFTVRAEIAPDWREAIRRGTEELEEESLEAGLEYRLRSLLASRATRR